MSYELLERDLPPMHPGGLLREDVLPALGIPLSRVAEALGVSRRTLRKILREEAAVTPYLALRLDKLSDNDPNLWVNLQAHYDLARLLRCGPGNMGCAGRVPRSTRDIPGPRKMKRPLSALRQGEGPHRFNPLETVPSIVGAGLWRAKNEEGAPAQDSLNAFLGAALTWRGLDKRESAHRRIPAFNIPTCDSLTPPFQRANHAGVRQG